MPNTFFCTLDIAYTSACDMTCPSTLFSLHAWIPYHLMAELCTFAATGCPVVGLAASKAELKEKMKYTYYIYIYRRVSTYVCIGVVGVGVGVGAGAGVGAGVGVGGCVGGCACARVCMQKKVFLSVSIDVWVRRFGNNDAA